MAQTLSGMSPGQLAALRGRQATIPVFLDRTMQLRVEAQLRVPVLRFRRTRVTLIGGSFWVLDWTLPQTESMIGAAGAGGLLPCPRRLGHGEVVLAKLPLSAVLGLEECR